MRSHKVFATLAALLLIAAARPAFADGRWTVSLGGGMSVSQFHGSALDAAVLAQVHPILGIGLEGGMAYMNLAPAQVLALPVEPSGGIGGTRLATLTDGLTRNRGLYMGPAVRIGQQVYAVASAGIYEFSDNNGDWMATRWGGSAGIGLTGKGRFSPRAEFRYRWAPGRSPDAVVTPFEIAEATPRVNPDASAYVFTIGFDLH